MSRFRSGSFGEHTLFVVLVMVAAMASAALETRAVLGSGPSVDSAATAAIAPLRPVRPQAAASSVDGTMVSVAATPPARRGH